jgi:hypothetical protein
MFRPIILVVLVASTACERPTEPRVMSPQTVVLFATPKIIADFDHPAASARAFLENYGTLTSRADETILVFAVGNTEHVLTYKGIDYWADSVEWARFTGIIEVDRRTLNYMQIDGIVRAFRAVADTLGVTLKVFDQVDGGAEFVREYFKLNYHPECFPGPFDSYDIRALLTADTRKYATAPTGIVAGTSCGRFLVDQMGAYVADLGFDGMMYGNQLGTRGRWQGTDGPGYSDAEAAAIRAFFAYSKQILGGREIIWFDSYNNTSVERDNYSVPPDAYQYMDYLLVSGFCVITFRERYLENLRSKIRLRPQTRILATLDYVDPWYEYDSMRDFPECSANLEQFAVDHRYDIDGVIFFANDDLGHAVPAERIAAFAERFFDSVD